MQIGTKLYLQDKLPISIETGIAQKCQHMFIITVMLTAQSKGTGGDHNEAWGPSEERAVYGLVGGLKSSYYIPLLHSSH